MVLEKGSMRIRAPPASRDVGLADLSKFEQFEAERLDLRKDAEQRGPILEQTGEQGLAAFQLRHHRGKGRQGGSS